MGRNKRLAADLARAQKVGLDSSVLIYHLEGLAPYADLTETVFSLLAKGELAAVISTISITELLIKPFAASNETAIMACERFFQGLPHTSIIAPGSAIAREAARLRAHYGLRTPDALLLGTALVENAKAFLTNDADLKRVRKESIAIVILEDYL
ncbi:MAG: PIN domain-containing protein [Candidatus Bipolaricaulota bacterium]|nr:PIN domain-containing protein [Candidatus Bipolaricaulota bacterium]